MRTDLLPVTLEGKISHVVEECGEVLQAIGKLQRFGENTTDPNTGIKYDNIVDLFVEMDHLEIALRNVREAFNR